MYQCIFRDLAYKTLAGSQWVSENLPQHWLYTCADDDMMPNLVQFVEKMEELMKGEMVKQNVICSSACVTSIWDPEFISSLPIQCGYSLLKGAHPIRGASKWQATRDIYEIDNYPTFCAGGWYTLPVKLSSAIYQTSRYCRHYYLEDVWIAGLIRIKHFKDTEDETIGIQLTNYQYAKHVKKNLELHWKNLDGIIFNKKNVVVLR